MWDFNMSRFFIRSLSIYNNFSSKFDLHLNDRKMKLKFHSKQKFVGENW